MAIAAGYGAHNLTKDIGWPLLRRAALFTIFILPIATALQFTKLELQNDPRIMARLWVEQNIPTGSKTLVYAEMTRLSSEPDAVNEQASIDPRSLRKIDKAEANLPADLRNTKHFHVINLYTVTENNFWNDLYAYARDNQYEYLIWDPLFLPPEPRQKEQLRRLASESGLLASFGTGGENFIMRDGYFPDIIKFLRLKTFNPLINIYEL